MIKLRTGLSISAVLPVAEFREEDYVLLLTRRGMLKKVAMSLFAKLPAVGATAIGLAVSLCPAGAADGCPCQGLTRHTACRRGTSWCGCSAARRTAAC